MQQKLTFVTKEQKAGGAAGSSCCAPADAGSRDLARDLLCCPQEEKNAPSWVCGAVPSPAGAVPRVSAAWSASDRWGMVKSRTGAYRMRYSVPAGLYAVGEPGKESDVLVTANYKLSFDLLRRSLAGLSAWVLVLDTKSINVWCAAGKGTFGTEELVKRIVEARLSETVSHRRIIVPQLGAVGVDAAAVQKRTGFRVSFGPVDARDIPAYIAKGYRKTEAMRTIRFPMRDRLVLTPMEINPAMKKFPWFAAAVLLLFGLEPSGVLFREAWRNGLPFLLLGLLAVFSGAFLTPVLLPFVPFRSFALKGWIVGLVAVVAVRLLAGLHVPGGAIVSAAAYLFFPALSSYIALQFTGSTTYTGMTGVRKELRYAIPAYIGSTGLAAVLLVIFKLREWGLV
jgi:hypothetical protein